MKLKVLEILWLNETDYVIDAFLSNAQATEINLDIRIGVKLWDGKDVDEILVIKGGTHGQREVKIFGSLEPQRIMQFPQTAEILKRLGPIGMENDLIIADLKSVVGIILGVMEELEVDEEHDKNDRCILIIRKGHGYIVGLSKSRYLVV